MQKQTKHCYWALGNWYKLDHNTTDYKHHFMCGINHSNLDWREEKGMTSWKKGGRGEGGMGGKGEGERGGREREQEKESTTCRVGESHSN